MMHDERPIEDFLRRPKAHRSIAEFEWLLRENFQDRLSRVSFGAKGMQHRVVSAYAADA